MISNPPEPADQTQPRAPVEAEPKALDVRLQSVASQIESPAAVYRRDAAELSKRCWFSSHCFRLMRFGIFSWKVPSNLTPTVPNSFCNVPNENASQAINTNDLSLHWSLQSLFRCRWGCTGASCCTCMKDHQRSFWINAFKMAWSQCCFVPSLFVAFALLVVCLKNPAHPLWKPLSWKPLSLSCRNNAKPFGRRAFDYKPTKNVVAMVLLVFTRYVSSRLTCLSRPEKNLQN